MRARDGNALEKQYLAPWEHSLLSPRSDDDPLRSALLDKVSEVEAEAWRRDGAKWWTKHRAEIAEWIDAYVEI